MTNLLDLVRHIGQNAGGTTAALEILLRVTLLLSAAMLIVLPCDAHRPHCVIWYG